MIRFHPMLGLLLVLLSSQAVAQQPIYQPDPEAPPVRVAGSVRGADQTLSVQVLAPNDLAVTINPSPTLYWFASSPVTDPVELVLIEEGGEEALVEVMLAPPLSAGVHRFEFPPSQTLRSGVTYQWSVAVVADPDSRSNDVFASALMTHVDPPDGAAGTGGPQQQALALAREGIWYDALAVLYRPDSRDQVGVRDLRVRLLHEVGLGEVARFENKETP